MKKYAILNPRLGTYEYTDSLDKISEIISNLALDLYINHCHGNPYSVVTVNNDGSETWETPTGKNMSLNTSEIKNTILKNITPISKINGIL